MVLEVAMLDVREGQAADFEVAFLEASRYIAASPGYVSHQLLRCIETPNRYLLEVQWRSLEDHVKGFRQSERYEHWRRLLHHFYDPFPSVEHYEPVFRSPAV
jgi:heme-degrading monooxygenase HmoA